jgi:hypothetical protein
MSLRFVKDKLRVESPQLKDTPTALTVADPSVDRDEHGHFGPGNGAAIGRGLKQVCREGLEGLDADLARDAMMLYRGVLRSLPAAGPSVRQLVAAQCRHAVIATAFANAAAKAGLASPDGIKLAEHSRSHDLAAQRLAVTAFDLATREAAARPREVHPALISQRAEIVMEVVEDERENEQADVEG